MSQMLKLSFTDRRGLQIGKDGACIQAQTTGWQSPEPFPLCKEVPPLGPAHQVCSHYHPPKALCLGSSCSPGIHPMVQWGADSRLQATITWGPPLIFNNHFTLSLEHKGGLGLPTLPTPP